MRLRDALFQVPPKPRDETLQAVFNHLVARHPGGGFLGGSQAQEENLARFANDSAQTAQPFAEALAAPAIRGHFRRLKFAFFDPKPPHAVLRAFEHTPASAPVWPDNC